MAEKKTKTKGKKPTATATDLQDQELSDQEKTEVKGGGIVINDKTSLGSPTLNPTSPTLNYMILGRK